MDNPDTIQGAEAARPSRRALLRALGLGGAATALVVSARPAAAQEGGTDATTTTAPPKRPQAGDLPLIAAAQVLELTAAAAYRTAVGRLSELGYDDATSAVVVAMVDHHQAYGEALGALYGPGAPSAASDTVKDLVGGDAFANGDGAAVLAAAQALEEVAVDTHLTLLDALQSIDAAALVASIQVVEARHAAVLSRLKGTAYGADAPAVEDGGNALTIDQITGKQ